MKLLLSLFLFLYNKGFVYLNGFRRKCTLQISGGEVDRGDGGIGGGGGDNKSASSLAAPSKGNRVSKANKGIQYFFQERVWHFAS